jgi:hypothetical protein
MNPFGFADKAKPEQDASTTCAYIDSRKNDEFA